MAGGGGEEVDGVAGDEEWMNSARFEGLGDGVAEGYGGGGIARKVAGKQGEIARLEIIGEFG